MDNAEEAAGRSAPSDDGITGQPVCGAAALSVADFKSAWIELPNVQRTIAWLVALAVLIPLATWLGSPKTLGVTLLATPIVLLSLGYGMLRGRARWATTALGGSATKVVEYRFDGSGYHAKEPGRQSHLEWSSLHGHTETESAFLIYTTPQFLSVVPKRAFPPTDQARLRQALDAKVPPYKHRGGGNVKTVLLLWGLLLLAFVAIWQFLNPK